MKELPDWVEVRPTRVRRNYRGGAALERWTGEGAGIDGQMPEDWIASTVEARNPGLAALVAEGVTRVRLPSGRETDLRAEIERVPEHYLGARHVRGREIGFLAKLLDSSIRLHIQAHPTAAFARAHLNSAYGKLEAYVILGVRTGVEPYVLLGFNRAPAKSEWRRIIAEQDLVAMEACLNRVPLRTGDVWLVPGGVPHAIGEGVLMLEVMESSDWVVRCEFERAGIVVPPAARFMGRDLDFCLNVFDYRSESPVEVTERCRLQPRVLRRDESGEDEELVGAMHTGAFALRRLRVRARQPVPAPGEFRLLLIVSGDGLLRAGDVVRPFRSGARYLLPAGAQTVEIEPAGNAGCEAILCLPGAAA